MEAKNKRIFWQALVIAMLIFALGLFAGYLIEANRVGSILQLYQQSEIDLLDIRIQSDIFSSENLDCDSSISGLIDFANRVYEEALILEKFEGANVLSSGILIQHKKYDLLRASIFVNSQKIRQKCQNYSFDTLVYFYEYLPESQEQRAKQEAFSRKLLEIKSEVNQSILLLPIAANIGANSVFYLMQNYNITTLPSVLINEQKIFSQLEELKNLS